MGRRARIPNLGIYPSFWGSRPKGSGPSFGMTVEGLVSRVQGLGVEGLGFRGFVFRVQGLGV